MIDPTGAIVAELREGVRALGLGAPWDTFVVRGGRARDDAAPFAVVVRNMTLRNRPGPGLATVRYVVRCYGVDEVQATDCYLHVSDVLDQIGPRIHERTEGRIGIHRTRDVLGGQPGVDPDSQQPLESVTIEAIVAAQAVPTD